MAIGRGCAPCAGDEGDPARPERGRRLRRRTRGPPTAGASPSGSTARTELVLASGRGSRRSALDGRERLELLEILAERPVPKSTAQYRRAEGGGFPQDLFASLWLVDGVEQACRRQDDLEAGGSSTTASHSAACAGLTEKGHQPSPSATARSREARLRPPTQSGTRYCTAQGSTTSPSKSWNSPW